MPIQLKLRDDLEEAIAAYKHYDVLIVNAMFDGMNLVAKEGRSSTSATASRSCPRTRARTRSSASSRCRQPVRRPGARRLDPRGADDAAEERARRADGLSEIVTARDPGDWIDEQLAATSREKERVEGGDAAGVGRGRVEQTATNRGRAPDGAANR
jgi:trehalose 6-phosphate synthase